MRAGPPGQDRRCYCTSTDLRLKCHAARAYAEARASSRGSRELTVGAETKDGNARNQVVTRIPAENKKNKIKSKIT